MFAHLVGNIKAGGIALADFVDGVIAQGAVTIDGEVPVLVAQAGIQAKVHGRDGAVTRHVTVCICDNAIAVTVHQTGIDGSAVLVVELLEQIEGVRSETLAVHGGETGIATHGSAGGRTQEAFHFLCGELGDFGVLEGNVAANAPMPVVGFYRNKVQGEFHTLVHHVADVLDGGVAEVLAQSGRSHIQQVKGVAVVNLHGTGDAVVDETEVQTGIPGFGGFPLQVLVIGLRSQDIDELSAHVVLHQDRGFLTIQGHGGIIVVTDILLTGTAPSQAQLEGGHGIYITQEAFVLDVPCKGCGREDTPLVTLGKTGRSVGTDCSREQVTGKDGIIHTAEERQQVILFCRCRVLLEEVFRLPKLRFIVVSGAVVFHIVVLPGITGHHIQVGVLELMVVVGIELQQRVAVEIVADVGVVRRTEGGHVGAQDIVILVMVLGHVVTQVQVEAEVFEAVHFVVQLEIADRTQGSIEISALVNLGQRVDASHGVGVAAIVPVKVGTVLCINGLGRVHAHGIADGTGAGTPVGFLNNALHIGIDAQVILEELGRQVHV